MIYSHLTSVVRMSRQTISHLIIYILCSLAATAQPQAWVEAQASFTLGDHEPLWLNANKYGLSGLTTSNGYLRAAIKQQTVSDSTQRRWALGYGADMALAYGMTSNVVVQQAYGELRWLKGLLTIGSKEYPAELKNNRLSSGAQTLGINARPVPSVRLSLPDYWSVPFTRGWLGVKGHVAYGLTTDDRWQRNFTHGESKHTEHSRLHTKAGYLRIGKKEKPVSLELGLEMACQYGGTTITDLGHGLQRYENEGGLGGAWRALIPGGGDNGEGVYANKAGNHLGSYLMRLNIEQPQWSVSLYADHFFEDHSQMFFIDYNGYGEGAEYNEWTKSKWFVYDLKDIMLGVELQLKGSRIVDHLLLEYLYTKYQSGPIYHDRTPHLSDHVAGLDEYYNNYMQTGWQHWGQVMGNPLYRSPLYNDDATIRVANNRFWAWHLGVSGQPAERFGYRLLATVQRGWGTYSAPLPDPEGNVSLLFEASYRLPVKGEWSMRAAAGTDAGGLLGNNIGIQLTLRKEISLKRKQ